MRQYALGLASIAIAAQSGTVTAQQTEKNKLPNGFVYLSDVAPTIIEDVRYATRWNFTGAPVPGYQNSKCILARPVAEALARVQNTIKKDGLALKVYDCYRPLRAVKAFVSWARGKDKTRNTGTYHPRLSKSQVVAEGYIATRSSHPRGISVDLTLVPLAAKTKTSDRSHDEIYGACNSPHARRIPDSSIDMGTGWDCFDRASHTNSREVSPAARQNRNRLRRVMKAEGFKNFAKEWWHYSLAIRGFGKSHDYVVR